MVYTPEEIKTYRDQYLTQGYVIIPNLIPSHLFSQLQTASDNVTSLSRSGTWPHIRVVGKQFPPWNLSVKGKGADDVWGVQNLMHPGLREEVFAEWYGSEGMLGVSAGLMDCEVGDMQFELFNLLINPLHSSYALKWHRDAIKPTATSAEEEEALKIKHYGIQWNAALYDDECLSIVPNSHLRIRTEEERKVTMDGGIMPGGLLVKLKAGEVVFYNNNILHVGSYNPAIKRRTLHGSYGSAPPGNTSRARNVLQHDLSYTLDPAFRENLPGDLKGMLDRLNDMREGLAEKNVGYSQDD